MQNFRIFIPAIIASVGLLAGCATTPISGSSNVSPSPLVSAGPVEATLASLPVKGGAPKTGYDRDEFGSAWKDVDGNGCDTRNDILIRDLVERQMRDECVVLSGVLYPDPYTGEDVVFVRGKSVVDVDHVVSLGNAWVTGAALWDRSKREAFANDPLNLLAVSARANRQKSDGDAATWLPSNGGFRCDLVALQVAVKVKHGLWVTPAESEAMLRVLDSCPGLMLPVEGVE